METVNLDSWDAETKVEEISVSELDAALKSYFHYRTCYEKAREDLDCELQLFDQAKEHLMSLLEAAGKRNWAVDDIGKITIAEKLTVKVPADIPSKVKMLEFFKARGEDVYNSMVTVNYMTLNSYYKQELENNPNFRIDGVEEGYVEKTLRFNRSK